jgi:nucleotide-binding universal stress UspA family protein
MSTTYTIAVGYDGSSDADSAVRWAFEHSHNECHSVVAVHAAGMLEHLSNPLPRDVTPPHLLELAIASRFEVSRLRWFVEDGDPCSVLLRTCALPVQADLLVVGSRGLGNRSQFLLGSTSLEIVQHATLPVVVVPSCYPTMTRTATL